MTVKSHLKRLLRSNSAILLAVTAAVLALFSYFNRNFLNPGNVRNIMNAMSFGGVLAAGMTLLLIGGEVDLSSGAVACFSGVVAAVLVNAGVPWPFAFGLTIIFGALCGLVNAMLINGLNFLNFIATLGMMWVYQGFVNIITQNKNISIPEKSFWVIGETTAFNTFPLPFIIMLILMIGYGIVLSSTNFGRSVYMCGGNRRAARLCGINPKKISSLLYIHNGALAAVAGAVLASRMKTASPVAGNNAALDAITAAVLGGVSFSGGAGGMTGCFIGILLLNAFSAGLVAVDFPSYWRIVANGSLLVIALCLDYLTGRSRRQAIGS